MERIYKITEILKDETDYDDAGDPYVLYSDDEYYFKEEDAMARVNRIVERALKEFESMRITSDCDEYKKITNYYKSIEVFIKQVDVN